MYSSKFRNRLGIGKLVHNPVNELELLSILMGQLPRENSNVLSIFVEKGWKLSGQKAVLLKNEYFDPKTIQLFRSVGIWRMVTRVWNEQNEVETAVHFQETQVATLWSNDHV
jgi:hypothetical protein